MGFRLKCRQSLRVITPTISFQSRCKHITDNNYCPERDNFQNGINDVFAGLNKWFKAYKVALCFDNFVKFAATAVLS
jgi:hypothetical protein